MTIPVQLRSHGDFNVSNFTTRRADRVNRTTTYHFEADNRNRISICPGRWPLVNESGFNFMRLHTPITKMSDLGPRVDHIDNR